MAYNSPQYTKSQISSIYFAHSAAKIYREFRTPATIWSLIGHLVTLNLGISGTKYQ